MDIGKLISGGISILVAAILFTNNNMIAFIVGVVFVIIGVGFLLAGWYSDDKNMRSK
jgi:hypothetical protein